MPLDKSSNVYKYKSPVGCIPFPMILALYQMQSRAGFELGSLCSFPTTITITSRVKLTTVVEGDPKAPFSLGITTKCRRGRFSFPWIAPLYPWSVSWLSVKQGGIKYHFLSMYVSICICMYICILSTCAVEHTDSISVEV